MIDLSKELSAWFTSELVQDELKKLFREVVNAEFATVMDGELLNVAEAARILSMTEGAVRKAAERGQLPCVRLDRRLRFRRAELLRLGR